MTTTSKCSDDSLVVPAVRGLANGISPTLEINTLCSQLEQQGKRVYRFGFGQSPFPVPEPAVQALQQHAHEKDYLPVAGLPALRQAVARFHQETNGLSLDPENVIIGPGSKELLFALTLVFNGATVIPAPSWVSYKPQGIVLHKPLHVVQADTQTWKVTPALLEQVCIDNPTQRLMLVLNSPSNPIGVAYTRDELCALADVCRKHGVLVLSDEIYSSLMHPGHTHVSMASVYPEGTIVTSGLSKWAGAGGWRVGYMAFPDQLCQLYAAVRVVASESFSAVAAPMQYAACVALDPANPALIAYRKHSCRVLAGIARHTHAALTRAGIAVLPSQGGFYHFINASPLRDRLAARGISTSKDMCMALLKDTGVALLAGSHFLRPDHELSARLAYVDFDGGAALQAAAAEDNAVIDDAFIRQHCPRVVQGIQRICEWVAL